MAQRRYPLLAREGWAHIVIALALALGVHFLWGVWAALPVWLFLVFVLNFFRDPVRAIPADPTAIVCPADGKVVGLSDVDDPYLKRRARRISIFMNVFDVHSNRSPV